MDSNNPPFWPNSLFPDFTSYGDQSAPTDFRQRSAQPSYTHPDWSGPPDQGDQPIPGSTFNPTFQSSRTYLSQPNSYGGSPGNLVPVQHQSLRIPFSSSNPTNVNGDSSSISGDRFVQSNEEYRRRGSGFPPQQRTTFGNQNLAQISPPPALYHPGQALDHPGGQAYHHQVLPLSDISTEGGALDLFGPSSIHSRVSSQDGCVYFVSGMSNAYRDHPHRSFRSLDSPNNQQSLPLHSSPLRPGGGVGKTHDTTGYLQAGPSPPAAGSLKRIRSQEDSFAYDPTPSGDDCDQPKEDGNRTKS